MEIGAILQQVLPCPTSVRDAEYSMVMSADDEIRRPSPELITTILDAVRIAQRIDLSDVCERIRSGPLFPNVWPGEHYKLLAALVELRRPKLVIEIGTATGLSALALRKFLQPQARVVTFDILPWGSLSDTCLREQDFSSGQLVQIVEDLCEVAAIDRQRMLLEQADIIFIDAAKDGICEPRLIENLRRVSFKTPPLVIFDYIRLRNMLRVWREISAPKLDVTSFGHRSGTGLVKWNW